MLASVMLATVADYGISADAGVQHRWGRRLLRWYATFGNEPRVTEDLDITKYGGFCEVLSELAVVVSPFETYTTRHLVNVGFAFAAFLATVAMGRRLAGQAGGFLALAVLALTPPFYGHAFFNSKDTPFAGMYALALAAVLACDDWPRVRWPRLLGAGTLIGLAAAVRVGAIVLFGFALALWFARVVLRGDGSGRAGWPGLRALSRLAGAWAAALGVGWVAMIAFWPWAMLDPLRNPFRAASRFSRYWEDMLVFYDGRLQLTSQVSRFYLPNWFALTLPESYPIALALGCVALVLLRRSRSPLARAARERLLEAAWLTLVPASLVAGVVVHRMPLYDGLRHFLFLMPLLAVLAGAGAAVFLRSPAPAWARRAGLAALLAALALTFVDMVRLHPYQAVYFNRSWAGGMKAGLERYEGDYFCLSYKEGCEWLLRRFAGARCSERIKVAGNSVAQQTELYLQATREGRALFSTVPGSASPHYVLATTRFQDHLRLPGKTVFTVERLGATLLYLAEARPPACELASR